MDPTLSPSHLTLLLVYYGCLSLLACLGAHRIWLLAARRIRSRAKHQSLPEDPPRVLVQLPLYNEPEVAGRIVEASQNLDYPADKLVVQILDDSTDNTTDLLRSMESTSPEVRLHHRTDRTGFKAGALIQGLKADDSPYVAMFDSDFIPQADFLQLTLPHLLADEQLAFVQARWDHLNRNQSFLTRAQAALLDGHFLGEHSARSRLGLILNFNGTAGVWRRTAIDDAGGWQHDTLTEDLDITYRAHFKGWKCQFLESIAVPAELPSTWSALRSQQARWSRGSIQCARKLLLPLWRSDLPLSIRAEGSIPLLANLAWPLVVVLMVLLFPVFVVRQSAGLHDMIWLDLALLLPATLCFLLFYSRILMLAGRRFPIAITEALLAMLLAIGLSMNNSKAVLLGLLGGQGVFVRTPKQGDSGKKSPSGRRPLSGFAEATLALYLVFTAWIAIAWEVYSAIPFTLFFATGLLWAAVGSIRERLGS